MRVHEGFFPAAANGGCCLVTRVGSLGKGEKVIELPVAVEDLPAFGTVCISESGVKELCSELGLQVGSRETNRRLRRELAEATKLNEDYRAIIKQMVDAALNVGVADASVLAEALGAEVPA